MGAGGGGGGGGGAQTFSLGKEKSIFELSSVPPHIWSSAFKTQTKTVSLENVFLHVFVMHASGMARYMDPVFCLFVRMDICPSTFATAVASTLLSWSVSLKLFEILWENVLQI